jgi:nitrate reductase gamma subunit
MNSKDALVFIILGFAMGLLPSQAPGWFPQTGGNGSSVQALWLASMSSIEVAIGGLFLIRRLLVPRVLRWAAFEIPRLPGSSGEAGSPHASP